MPDTTVQLPPNQISRHSLRRLARYRISTSNNKQLETQKSVEHRQNETDFFSLLPSTSTSNFKIEKECLNEALEKIFEEAQSSLRLNLSWRKLKFFFSDLYESYDLSDTLFLDLSGNYLNNLPDFITQFLNLKTLIVQRNRLSEPLESIIHLKSLTFLDLSSNYLKDNDLPNAFYINLQNLNILILTGNLFTKISANINYFAVSLQELDVSSNQLTTVPKELGDLKALRILNISDNCLTELPAEIAKIEKLSLNVTHNSLTHLPVDFWMLADSLWSNITFKVENNPLIFPPLNIVQKGRKHIAKWLKNQIPNDSNNEQKISSLELSNIFQFKTEQILAESCNENNHSCSKLSLNLFSSNSNDLFKPNSKPICSPLIINTTTNNNHQSNENLNNLTSLNNAINSSVNLKKIGGMDSGYASTVDENRFSREYPVYNSLEEIDEMNSTNHQTIQLKNNEQESTYNKDSKNINIVNNLTEEIMLAFADEEKSITLAFEQLKNNNNNSNSKNCLNENNLYYSQSSNKLKLKKISRDNNNNNVSFDKNLTNENNAITFDQNVNQIDISINESINNNFINNKEILKINKNFKNINLIIKETDLNLAKELKKNSKDLNEKTINSNNINNIMPIIKSKNLATPTLPLPTTNKQKTMLTENKQLNINNKQLDEKNDLSNNCTESIDKVESKVIANSLLTEKINLNNDLKLFVEKKKCEESKPNLIVSKKLNEINKSSTTRIASKFIPISSLSSTLPRKKIIKSTALKNDTTSLSAFASTENILKENKTIVKPIAGSTINLTTMSSLATKELSKLQTTNALKKNSNLTLGTSHQRINVNLLTNNMIKNSVIKSKEKKQSPADKTILQTKIGTTNKSATNINRLPTTVQYQRTLTENNQKKIIPVMAPKLVNSSKPVIPTSSSLIKAPTLKPNRTNLLTTDKKTSTSILTDTQKAKTLEKNTYIRSVRGKSSVPRITSTTTTAITATKKITNNKKRAASTTNLIAPLKNETLTQKTQASSINLESINKMCRILKNKMPEIKIDANNLNALSAELSKGVLLCRFINKIQPRAISNILLPQPSRENSTQSLKFNQNIENFLSACRHLGVEESLLCITSASVVNNCIQLLPSIAQIIIALQNITINTE